ncbi:PcfJ domain-containing protein [Ligilactobacillus equi]|uniref:Uncharacterized protein n=1 Tax=Ligilactobacillus equi DPC 6820 TaxID=1392007 RepID=V7HX85_9LACO|nr:PcfJ domain-containing protein [Ligilactobacillus equi]ETA74502.1 hypothetical protein LEQ_0367 [Ligilactobacillus equi DPC 6820]
MTKQKLIKIWNNRLKPTKAFWKEAHSEFPVYIWQNKEQKIVSSTRKVSKRLINNIRLTKNTTFRKVNQDSFIYVKGTKKRIELQEWDVIQTTPDGKEKFTHELRNLIVLEKGQKPLHLNKPYPESKHVETGLRTKAIFDSAMSAYIINDFVAELKRSFLSDLFVDNQFEEAIKDQCFRYYARDYEIIENIVKYHDRLNHLAKLGAYNAMKALISSSQYSNINKGKLTDKFIRDNVEFLKENPSISQIGDVLTSKTLAAKIGVAAYKISNMFRNKIIIPEDFAESNLKYIDFNKIGKEVLKQNNLRNILDNCYKYAMEIEFCQKIGAFRMADYLVSGPLNYYHNLTIDREFLKANKQVLKNNPSIDYFLNRSRIEEFAKELRIKTGRLSNYLIKHNVSIQAFESYVDNIKYLKWDINKKTLFPDKFKINAEDAELAVELDKETQENQSLKLEFDKAVDDFKQYELTFKNFVFTIPHKPQDLIEEGVKLNNCLKSYRSKFAKEQTVIVFVRTVDAPNKSLFALEVNPKTNNIVQFRAKNNALPSDEANEIVKEYVEQVAA